MRAASTAFCFIVAAKGWVASISTPMVFSVR